MKTYLECIPCFFQQALETSRLAGADSIMQKKILDEVCRLLPDFPLDLSPPRMAIKIYTLINKITGKSDPFDEIKKKSNRLALNVYPELKKKIELSSDRLLTAVELAIAGNIIDYGVKTSLDIEKEINGLLDKDFSNALREDSPLFDYADFKEALSNASRILYLGDNAGEVVFDRILLEEIRDVIPPAKDSIFYAVRGKPTINDALMEDAKFCGLDKSAKIISNGVGAPGTILELCSKEFLEIYEAADMIISKGQGNFETLDGENGLIFFLLKVKCPMVARHLDAVVGDIILKGERNYARMQD